MLQDLPETHAMRLADTASNHQPFVKNSPFFHATASFRPVYLYDPIQLTIKLHSYENKFFRFSGLFGNSCVGKWFCAGTTYAAGSEPTRRGDTTHWAYRC